MGIETKPVNNRVNTNRMGKKGRRRHQKKAVAKSPVQMLYDTCKEVSAHGGVGFVPSPDNIEKLRAVLDDIKPSDFGLSPEMPYFRKNLNRVTQAIRYLHIYECEKFSIGIFCLPPSGVIPLHNHPGMTVFGKLLFGTMHIKSYDWAVDAPCSTSNSAKPSEGDCRGVLGFTKSGESLDLMGCVNAVSQCEGQQSEGKQPSVIQREVRLAKVKVDSDFTAPCNTSILYPADGGNMHCLTAQTPCAVLDMLCPPYNDDEGRHCTYYHDFPCRDFLVDGVSIPEEEREGYAWLQEREKPGDLVFIGELYKGPSIVDK